MARKSADDPLGWYGTRTVSWVMPCGMCSAPTTMGETVLPDGKHNCVHEIGYFDKLWLCSCECNRGWKPVAVVVEKDGSIGAPPENLVVAEYLDSKTRKKKAKEEAAAAAEVASVEDASENEEEPEQEVVVHTEDTV